MRKNVVRLFVVVLAFTVATAALYFFAWDNLKILNPYEATHTAENDSPYAVLDGTTVRILPYNATFRIPEGWLTPNPIPEPAKNLHLSYDDLNELYWNDGSDEEDAQVINSILSFANCAAHFGDRGWGNYMWNDLQGRVYVVNLTPEDVFARIDKQGLNKASSVFEKASLSSGQYQSWKKTTLDILNAPTHFTLNKDLDFYYRSFDNKTVIFVFLHTGRFQDEITLILDSFSWSS